ncbi:hypothetical protein ACJO2E_08500 [Marinobacter sp. M1N3S26]|uniref:hypothetical protein n=1 Tax=Marinobacter sp. M1N3S26 TaxID=3382299 RepID=UPI00387B08AE
MSRGEILNHKEDGLYRVRLKYAVEQLLEDRQRCQERLQELNGVLVDRLDEKDTLESTAWSLERDIDTLIPQYVEDPAEHFAEMTALQSELIRIQSGLSLVRFDLARIRIERLELQKRISVIDSLPEDITLDAWCADFTEDLSGEVGLIDLNDEGGQGIIIQPGYDGNAAYDPARDGQLVHREAQTGAQMFFNAAILPGIQKWFPRYRVGTISNIVVDTCTVLLDPASSSAQELNINQQLDYTSVPIMYMDCNGAAFEDGDRVVVRFTQSGPLVVGFEEQPKPCDLPVFILANGNRIIEMEPDFSAIRRSFGFVSNNTYSIAVCQDQIAYIYGLGLSGGDSVLNFMGGPNYGAGQDEVFYGVHGDLDGIWVSRNDFEPIPGTPLFLRYNLDGQLDRQVSLTTGDLDAAAYTGSNFTSDGETLTGLLQGYQDGPLRSDWYHFLVDAQTGARTGLRSAFSRNPQGTCINQDYMFIGSRVGLNPVFVEVFEKGSYSVVSTFNLQTNTPDYQAITASRTKFYAFLTLPQEQGGPAPECYVEIYGIADGVCTYERTVNLNADFSVESVYSAAVDSALLLQ